MKYALKLEEQETIIRFMRDDETAEIYSCDTIIINKLDRKVASHPGTYELVKEDEYGKWYRCPKDRIGFRPPAREYTDEERQARADRARNNAAFKKNNGLPLE